MKRLKKQSLKQVRKLALELGRKALKRDLIIGLVGPLGSGKTTFTKSLAKVLGITRVTSPTFIILSRYLRHPRSFYHLDFYRLNKLGQLDVLGLDEIINSKNRTVVIEWIDKFPGLKKGCDIIIKFKINPDHTRDVTIHPQTKNFVY